MTWKGWSITSVLRRFARLRLSLCNCGVGPRCARNWKPQLPRVAQAASASDRGSLCRILGLVLSASTRCRIPKLLVPTIDMGSFLHTYSPLRSIGAPDRRDNRLGAAIEY